MSDIAHYICKMGTDTLKALGKNPEITDIIGFPAGYVNGNIAVRHLS